MITIGVIVFVVALGSMLIVIFGWGRRRSSHVPEEESGQEHRVKEIHDSSERYRAQAAHLQIRAAERARERNRRREQELERQYELYARNHRERLQ